MTRKNLALVPWPAPGGFALRWTWWELVNVGGGGEGWDQIDRPSTDDAVYDTEEEARAALAAYAAAGRLPAERTCEDAD